MAGRGGEEEGEEREVVERRRRAGLDEGMGKAGVCEPGEEGESLLPEPTDRAEGGVGRRRVGGAEVEEALRPARERPIALHPWRRVWQLHMHTHAN